MAINVEIEKCRLPATVNETRDCFVVEITDEDYDRAEKASHNRDSSNKAGGYGAGLKQTANDKRKVEREGCLGEIGYGVIIGQEPDLSFIKGGDKYDFIDPDGTTTDVKTGTDATKNYVLAENEYGRFMDINKDIYVASKIVKENRVKRYAKIIFYGYQTKRFVNDLPTKPTPMRNRRHQNKEILYKDTLPLV